LECRFLYARIPRNSLLNTGQTLLRRCFCVLRASAAADSAFSNAVSKRLGMPAVSCNLLRGTVRMESLESYVALPRDNPSFRAEHHEMAPFVQVLPVTVNDLLSVDPSQDDRVFRHPLA
jgi:hypothetical protein